MRGEDIITSLSPRAEKLGLTLHLHSAYHDEAITVCRRGANPGSSPEGAIITYTNLKSFRVECFLDGVSLGAP